MGSLKPGATYIYEREKEVVYAREMGADPKTRKVIGWSHGQPIVEGMTPDIRWSDILTEARSNPTLQKALDRVIMIYKLSKDKV